MHGIARCERYLPLFHIFYLYIENWGFDRTFAP